MSVSLIGAISLKIVNKEFISVINEINIKITLTVKLTS